MNEVLDLAARWEELRVTGGADAALDDIRQAVTAGDECSPAVRRGVEMWASMVAQAPDSPLGRILARMGEEVENPDAFGDAIPAELVERQRAVAVLEGEVAAAELRAADEKALRQELADLRREADRQRRRQEVLLAQLAAWSTGPWEGAP